MEIYLIIIAFFVGIAIIYYLLFYGLIYGAEYQRISGKRLKKLIELGNLDETKTVYDLGAGFGRIMFKAAESGANVVGYEIDPVKVMWLKNQTQKKLVFEKQTNIEVVQGNLLDADLSKADVVYCYLFGPLMQKVGENASKQMKEGSLLISAEHQIKNWKPTIIDDKNKIYVYTIGVSNIE
jgi:ribosomal protein L11 methylase PrmA